VAARRKGITVATSELAKVLLPAEVHRDLKVAAAKQRRTLRSVLIEAAQDWLKRNEGGSEWIKELSRDKRKMRRYVELSQPKRGQHLKVNKRRT